MFTGERAARIPSTSARARASYKSVAFEILLVLVARASPCIPLARSRIRRAVAPTETRERKAATIRKQRQGVRRVKGTPRGERERERESFIRRSGDRSPLNAAKESEGEEEVEERGTGTAKGEGWGDPTREACTRQYITTKRDAARPKLANPHILSMTGRLMVARSVGRPVPSGRALPMTECTCVWLSVSSRFFTLPSPRAHHCRRRRVLVLLRFRENSAF